MFRVAFLTVLAVVLVKVDVQAQITSNPVVTSFRPYASTWSAPAPVIAFYPPSPVVTYRIAPGPMPAIPALAPAVRRPVWRTTSAWSPIIVTGQPRVVRYPTAPNVVPSAVYSHGATPLESPALPSGTSFGSPVAPAAVPITQPRCGCAGN